MKTLPIQVPANNVLSYEDSTKISSAFLHTRLLPGSSDTDILLKSCYAAYRGCFSPHNGSCEVLVPLWVIEHLAYLTGSLESSRELVSNAFPLFVNSLAAKLAVSGGQDEVEIRRN